MLWFDGEEELELGVGGVAACCWDSVDAVEAKARWGLSVARWSGCFCWAGGRQRCGQWRRKESGRLGAAGWRGL